MDARGREACRDGEVTVGDRDVELVAAPVLRLAFAVALASPVAERRQQREVRAEVPLLLEREGVVVLRVRVDLRAHRREFGGCGLLALGRCAFTRVYLG